MADALELGKRAVACPSWRWMGGMLVRSTRLDWDWSARVYDAASGRVELVDHMCGSMAEHKIPLSDMLELAPDFSDPATRGCLLELVREAWKRPNAFAMQIGGWWRVGDAGRWLADTCATEAEALVAALEAA